MTAVQDAPAAEEQPAVEDQPAMEDQPALENQPALDDVTFPLPGYCRAPNTSNACMLYNCTNNTRLRVPNSSKVQLLLNNNYYIPPYARVCQEHLEDNT